MNVPSGSTQNFNQDVYKCDYLTENDKIEK